MAIKSGIPRPRGAFIGLRISADGVRAIDELRGSWSRSEWARRAFALAATRDKPLRGPSEQAPRP